MEGCRGNPEEGVRVAWPCAYVCAHVCAESSQGGQYSEIPLRWLGPLGSKLSPLQSCSSFTSQGENCELHMKSTPW